MKRKERKVIKEKKLRGRRKKVEWKKRNGRNKKMGRGRKARKMDGK